MNKELYDRLIAEGLAPEKAEEIAKGSYVPTDDDTVDVDALTKAMGTVADLLEKGRPEHDDLIDGDPEVLDPEDPDAVVKAITSGADRVLAQSQAHIESRSIDQEAILDRVDALSKGFVALSEQFQAMVGMFTSGQEGIAKSLDGVKTELGAPLAPKSQMGLSKAIPAPGEDLQKSLTPMDVMSKALEMQRSTDDVSRQKDLGTAIARLDSGSNPHNVAAEFGIALS